MKEKSDELLRIICILTGSNVTIQVEKNYLRALLEVSEFLMESIIQYLLEKNSIRYQGTLVSINANGIDRVSEIKKNKKYKLLRFYAGKQENKGLFDGAIYFYNYDVLFDDSRNSYQECKNIIVTITGRQQGTWNSQIPKQNLLSSPRGLETFLFHYAKEHVIEKIKNNTLEYHERIDLPTKENENPKYIHLNELVLPEFARYEIEMPNESEVSKNINEVASEIVKQREITNTLFKSINKERLLILDDERNIKDLFLNACTEEDFTHRKSSLGHLARNFNLTILRKLVNEQGTEVKSVSLLEKYLQNNGFQNINSIKILRHIGNIRSGYPEHTDFERMRKSYKELGIPFPVSEYNDAWSSLLKKYLESLNELNEILKQIDEGLKK